MKRILLLSLALPTVLLLAGCFSGTSLSRVTPAWEGQLTSAGEPATANVTVENRGQFLFNWIPIWTGDATRPNLGNYNMWQNRMRPGYMRYMLEVERKKLKADRLVDLRQTEYSSGVTTLWLVWTRTVRIAAVAVKAPETPKTD